MDEIIGLFPVPFMRVPGALHHNLVSGLIEHFKPLALRDNSSSANLSHTQMLRPSDSALLVEVATLVTPKLIDFGALLFGERIGWSVKEMWVNVLQTGGRQAMHNHANSFVSGVLYLTPTHPEALLGVEHILSGYDHLLFVVGLLFLVGFRRRLILTVTAFTAAHSLTLASSALGLLVLRPPPVEATIALSIMLVAGEALRKRETLARRWPAMVAILFGLVHGLGFAGALKEMGLPDNHLWVALLTFNIGVEVGQLMALGVAWLVYRFAKQLPALPQLRIATLYAIGTMAAYWSLARIAAIIA